MFAFNTDLYSKIHVILFRVDRYDAKRFTTTYLDIKTTNLAREMGLTISKTCEKALKLAISRLRGTNLQATDALPQLRD